MKVKGKHVCNLNLGSDVQLPQIQGRWGKFWHKFSRFCQIWQYHPSTFCHFYSYPAVMIERQRQSYEAKYVIHPFSMFSLYWKSFMVFVNITHMSTSTFRISFIIDEYHRHHLHPCDIVLLVLNVFSWFDIVINFYMGYTELRQEGLDIILNKRRIMWNYISSWFICDLVSSIPLSLIFLQYEITSRNLLLAMFVPTLRLPRIYTVIGDLTMFVKKFTSSYAWYGGARHVMLFWLTAHWCSCLIYLPLVVTRYWYEDWKGLSFHLAQQRTDSFKTVSNPDLPLGRRYLKSLFVSLSGFFGTGFSLLQSSKSDEILVYSLVIIYSALFMIYNFAFILKVYLTIYSPTIRYYELLNQVEHRSDSQLRLFTPYLLIVLVPTIQAQPSVGIIVILEYMRLKQLPLPLKKRLRAFYYYRYQENYYSEDTVFSTLSEELRNEITLHTCHKPLDKVALFRDVPPTIVGSVLGCLHSEVYMPNDSVLLAGDIGDCMYFVGHGTVAIYSLKGVEVCHMEDGDHFGEVALLMKDRKRIVTAVAVEITQLYRLDVQDFQDFIMSDEMLYNRIAALASERMHKTVVLDDEFRREREKMQEASVYSPSHDQDPPPLNVESPEF